MLDNEKPKNLDEHCDIILKILTDEMLNFLLNNDIVADSDVAELHYNMLLI